MKHVRNRHYKESFQRVIMRCRYEVSGTLICLSFRLRIPTGPMQLGKLTT